MTNFFIIALVLLVEHCTSYTSFYRSSLSRLTVFKSSAVSSFESLGEAISSESLPWHQISDNDLFCNALTLA
jgi:hypothetical protein